MSRSTPKSLMPSYPAAFSSRTRARAPSGLVGFGDPVKRRSKIRGWRYCWPRSLTPGERFLSREHRGPSLSTSSHIFMQYSTAAALPPRSSCVWRGYDQSPANVFCPWRRSRVALRGPFCVSGFDSNTDRSKRSAYIKSFSDNDVKRPGRRLAAAIDNGRIANNDPRYAFAGKRRRIHLGKSRLHRKGKHHSTHHHDSCKFVFHKV